MLPTPEQLNYSLVEHLITSGSITSPEIASAFNAVLRHHFVPSLPLAEIYQDRSIGTKHIGDLLVSSSSQPTMMAIMLEQLSLKPGQRVLEIGAGTGYNAAIMAQIVGDSGSVVTLDIDQDLVDEARAHLRAAGYPEVEVICGDGGYGYPPNAPYDRIILTVGATDIMPAWWDQLKEGGRLVLPLELRGGQLSVAFKKERDQLVSDSIRSCGFIRMRGAFASESEAPIELGPEPGLLFMMASAAVPTGAETIYEWLQHPLRPVRSGVTVTPLEAWEGLGWRILLSEAEACLLFATGEPAAKRIFPPLTAFRESDHIRTVGLISPAGMALLAQPQHSQKRFHVQIYPYGDDSSLPANLQQTVQRWAAAGHPLMSQMQILAHRRGDAVPDLIGLSIAKRHTEFLIVQTTYV